MSRPRETYWYALKVFYNRVPQIRKEFNEDRRETFLPVRVEESYRKGEFQRREIPLVPSLLFVRCTERYLREFKYQHENMLMFYPEPGTGRPGRIDDREMENFRLATSRLSSDLSYLGEDRPELRKGERVRVTDGLYKGLEGVVRRVDRDRKLLVCISGVAVVAISHIDRDKLEKI